MMNKAGRSGKRLAMAGFITLAAVSSFCAGTVGAATVPQTTQTPQATQTPQTPQTPQTTQTPAVTGPVKENDYKQGKVYKISPKTKPLKASNYTKSELYNKKTKAYFTIRSYMEKFQKAGKGTLVFKKGTYTITNTVGIPSNVTIIFEKGVKLVKGTKTGKKKMPASISIFQLIRQSKMKKKGVYGGHDGEKNIHFVGKGGVTVDLKGMKNAIGIVMGHNQDVTVDRINFKNLNGGHFIEMDASNNVTITSCSFKKAKKKSDYVKEAINLDTPDKTTHGFNSAWSKYDKTPNENITITGCKFSELGRAVGTHKYSARGQQQIYHTNVVVRGNQISNMKYDAPIRILNWKDSVVENNTITTVKQSGKTNIRGILVNGGVNVSVKNNRITGTDRAIQFSPWMNSGAGSGYPVSYNVLTEQNLTDLATNVAKKMRTGEYYVRIDAKYHVYTNAQKVNIKKG